LRLGSEPDGYPHSKPGRVIEELSDLVENMSSIEMRWRASGERCHSGWGARMVVKMGVRIQVTYGLKVLGCY
jgi:hypothetical protein